MRTIPCLAAAAVLLLAGCGTDSRGRTEGGAAAGAATGAVVGALGGPVGVGVGALVGAGVGAGTGAATTPDQVNLGKPVWSNPETSIAGKRPAASSRQAASAPRHGSRRVARRPAATPAAAAGQMDPAAPVATQAPDASFSTTTSPAPAPATGNNTTR